MNLAGARPGKDLNVAKADAFVFRGKWILIDYDLADRLLVGQDRAGGESIDENLRPTWSGRRTGESVQLRLKLIGIIRKRVKFLAADYARAFITVRIGTQCSRIIDGHPLGFDRHA